MDIAYLVTPLLTWITVGPIKFLINSAKARKWAFNLVGNGGFPSNHSAVVSSMATLIALREGIGHPAFGVAVALCFIVIIDANSLRQHVGRQAAAINRLARKDEQDGQGGQDGKDGQGTHTWLRERMGHTKVEIIGGLCTGIAIGHVVYALFPRV